MNIIYADVDITDDVEVIQSDIHDNAGGIADSVELLFADPEGLWTKWKPQKGDKIQVNNEGFSSGKMYIDKLIQKPGVFGIRGISIPLSSKSNSTRSWEKIGFIDLAKDLSGNIGFSLETYDITNWLYDRIDQTDETAIGFLNRLCIREGCAVKVTDGKVVMYDERKQELSVPVETFTDKDLIGDYVFQDIVEGLKKACTLSYVKANGEVIKAEFKDPALDYGSTLKINERVSSLSEAERFSKGYLRNENKKMSGYISVNLNSKVAAGNMIEILDIGMADGNYFINKVVHRLTKKQSFIELRKPLEGY